MPLNDKEAGLISTPVDRVARQGRQCLQAICLLVLALMVQKVHADEGKRLEHMLSLTGIAAVMDSYPEQIHQQLRRPGTLIGGTDAALIEGRLLDACNGLDIKAALSGFVGAQISPAQLEAILLWYEAPLGRRLVAAERQAETPAGREDMKVFLAELDRQPVADDRIHLIRRFEQVGRLAYINLALIRALYETEFVAANALRSRQHRLDDGQLRAAMEQQFHGYGEVMLTGLAANMMAVSYYTLRSFSNSEIADYIGFLESDAGRALVRLYEDAPVYLFGQVVSRTGMRVPENFFHVGSGM